MGTSVGMGPGEVILAGLRDFGARWRNLVTAVAVVVLPVSAVGLAVVAALAPDAVGDLLTATMTPEELEASLASVTVEEWVRFGVAYAVFVVLSGLANIVAFGACLAIEREHVRGNELSYGAALREAFGRWHSLLWLVILSGLLTLIGLVLCIVPGIWLLISWLAAPVVLMHEGSKGRRAMGRSYRLTRPRFWSVVLVALLEFVGLGLIQSAATSLAGVVLPVSLEDVAESSFFAVMLLSTLAGLVTMAIHTCVVTRLYLDLVARSDPPVALDGAA